MVSAHNPASPQKEKRLKIISSGDVVFWKVGGGGRLVGVCVSCQPIYRSLPCSILFLNFLYKRLREGKRRVNEQSRGRGREEEKKSAIMDFILNPLPISQTDISPKKATSCPKKRTFLKKQGLKNR